MQKSTFPLNRVLKPKIKKSVSNLEAIYQFSIHILQSPNIKNSGLCIHKRGFEHESRCVKHKLRFACPCVDDVILSIQCAVFAQLALELAYQLLSIVQNLAIWMHRFLLQVKQCRFIDNLLYLDSICELLSFFSVYFSVKLILFQVVAHVQVTRVTLCLGYFEIL